MNGPITRDEFAELAVCLYEKCTGKTVSAGAMSAFTDTGNPEIFKVYELKVMSGTNLEKKLFLPKDLTSREQVAAMIRECE